MLQLCSPVGSQAVDQVLGLCTQAARSLIRVRTHPGFQGWAPRLLIEVRTYLGVFSLCAQTAWPLINVCVHPGALGLCTQVAKLLIWVHTDPWLWACAPGQLGR